MTRANPFRRVVRAVTSAVSLVAMVAGASLLLAPGADAADLVQQGWWYRNQAAPSAAPVPIPLVAPPETEPGEIVVEGAPDQATAVAALRYLLAPTETSPRLDLVLREGSPPPPASASILACRASSDWQPAEAGSFDEKPKVDETACIPGQPADDASGFTFPVGPLLSGSVLDIVLVPGRDPDAPEGLNGSVFQMIFQDPVDALTTATIDLPPQPGTDRQPPPDVGSGAGPDPGTTPGTDAGTVPSPVVPPQVGSAVPPGASTPQPAPVSVEATPALPPEDLTFAQIPDADTVSDFYTPPETTPGRILGFVVLLAGAAGAAWAWRSGQLSTADTGPVRRGLGRFSAERTGPPPSLT